MTNFFIGYRWNKYCLKNIEAIR